MKAREDPYEFENVYFDFNGIVHRCVDEWSGSDDVLFDLIEAYIVLLINICRPTVLLVIAIDGVAPRAKMNQQRSRRFKSKGENGEEDGEEDADEKLPSFDRNAITPGTDFMVKLSARLHAWAETATNTPELKGVTVVVSGDLTPGEGEHKIMDIIRCQPERTHCLFSNDADLIFLGVVSHPDKVYVLREKPGFNGKGPGNVFPAVVKLNDLGTAAMSVGGSAGSKRAAVLAAADAMHAAPAGAAVGAGAASAVPDAALADGSVDAAKAGSGEADDAPLVSPAVGAAAGSKASGKVAKASKVTRSELPLGDFEVYRVTALREWLASQFSGCDPQCLVEDFLAMCCLCGNDFLPQVEAFDIFEGGVDKLLQAYKTIDPKRGHLVGPDQALEMPRWQELLSEVAAIEAEARLDAVGLGLGSRKPPYHGAGPPTSSWDGLSVMVRNVPPHSSARDVTSGLSRTDCEVVSVHKARGRGKGERVPPEWLVRFADPVAAVGSLVYPRRIHGKQVTISWADPAKADLLQPPEEPFGPPADWRPALGAAVRENFEFWLGEKNLQGDAFLRRHVRASEGRWVPVRLFKPFNRLRSWCQDVPEITEMIRPSELLEVRGEGADAEVRGVVDYSMRPGETPEQVALQLRAVACFNARDFVGAVNVLKQEYYLQRPGPVPVGAPQLDNLDALAQHRSREFLVGIQWVVKYYTRGCPSWSWFFPGHFAPLAANIFEQAAQPIIEPPLDAPFSPEMQLLSVLPPQSSPLLPEVLRHLLVDSASPLIEFYPRDFAVHHREGQREWQGVVLLPFVDEPQLRAALAAVGWDCAGRAVAPTAHLQGDAARSWDFRPEEPLPPGRPCRFTALASADVPAAAPAGAVAPAATPAEAPDEAAKL